MDDSEETAFIVEQIEPMVQTITETVLKDEVYDDSKTGEWIDSICDRCTHTLVQMNKPFKYVVSATIVQRNGSGFHTAHSCQWDGANDNVARVVWPDPKQRDAANCRMSCIVTVFGIAL